MNTGYSTDFTDAQRCLHSAFAVYEKAKASIYKLPTRKLDELISPGVTIYSKAVDKVDELLAIAARDLVRANELDPDAQIVTKRHTLTFNDITAFILLLDAILHIEAGTEDRCGYGYTPDELSHGIDSLRKYLTYRPYDTDAVLLYAKTLVRAELDDEALIVLQKARLEHPGSFEIRMLLTCLEDNEHVNPYLLETYTGVYSRTEEAIRKFSKFPRHPREPSLREDQGWYQAYPKALLP